MKRWMVASFAMCSLVAANAMAALPAALSTAVSGIQTDAEAMIELVWPVVLAVFGGLVLIKLFKRAGSKI